MKNNEAISTKYFNMEKVNIAGFSSFCKNNILLIIAVTFTLFFTYGIRLLWYSIGFDSEFFMANKPGFIRLYLQLGRFGQALLSSRWLITGFNPFTAFFGAFCLIWFFTISWCYIIAIFSKDTGKNHKLIPFALVFMTMPVWAEQFYFIFQATENALIIALCPYVIYLLYKGFLDNEKDKIACAFVLLVFMISVYEAIILMFCCGVFICFLLLQENSDYEAKVYQKLCLTLFITLIAALAVYFFIGRVIIPLVFEIGRHVYPGIRMQWGRQPVLTNIVQILRFGYIITIGNISLVQNITESIILNIIPDASQVGNEYTKRLSRAHGNVFLLPIVVFFLLNVTFIIRKIIPPGRRLLYALAAIGVPLSIILLSLLEGGMALIRTLFALPLAFAFMFFFLIRTCKKQIAVVIVCLSLLTAYHQAQITAQLFHSDQKRYNEDVRLASEIYRLVTLAQPEEGNLPVAIVGNRQVSSLFNANFILGESLGISSFYDIFRNPHMAAYRSLRFMETLGMNFDVVNINQLELALKEAASMPVLPDPGSVRRMEDFIVVKISEDF